MIEVGLFFGSFNPIHLGHEEIIRYFSNRPSFDEIWVIPSPHNPRKKASDLIAAGCRLHMARLAVEGLDKVRICDIEFHLPTPSYTYLTLQALAQAYGDHHFSILVGSDTAKGLHLWKRYDEIVTQYPVHSYPRDRIQAAVLRCAQYTEHRAKRIDISSSDIRRRLDAGQSIQSMVSPAVWRYGKEIGVF